MNLSQEGLSITLAAEGGCRLVLSNHQNGLDMVAQLVGVEDPCGVTAYVYPVADEERTPVRLHWDLADTITVPATRLSDIDPEIVTLMAPHPDRQQLRSVTDTVPDGLAGYMTLSEMFLVACLVLAGALTATGVVELGLCCWRTFFR